MINTKQRILDTAERLFADQGYAGVSLRQIIADAGVNLAAIHYHFGSKEEVLDHVVMRKAGPVNRERLERLDQVEKGGRLEVKRILEAFLMPMAEVAEENPDFCRMMGRLQAEGILTQVLVRNFQPVLERFLGALRRALPDIPESEFAWRVHFMQGAIAHAMLGQPAALAKLDVHARFSERLERLVTFLSAGLSAPAPPAGGSPKSRTKA
jgi:AcrR family transcriptional regulator